MKRTMIAALILAFPLLAGEGHKDKSAGLQRAKAAIATRDTDGDGRLSPDEFAAGEHFFALLDRDGDGFLTAKELIRPKMRRRGKRRGGDQPFRRGGDQPVQRGPRPNEVLKRLDADGDGQLSREEYPKDARVPFERADGNGDGFLDRAEFGRLFGAERARAQGGQRPQMDRERIRRIVDGMMQRFDKDGDGRIAAAELPETQGRLDLSKTDKNQDGFIDRLELASAVSGRFARGRPGADDRGMFKRMLSMDSNKNGQIERAEWPKGREQGFDRLDADRNGILTKDEIAKAEKEMRARRGRGRAGEALFRRSDANGDGRIDATEWKMRPELFRKLDANGDGFITRDEVTPKGPRRRRERYDVRSGKDSAHFLQKYDKNGDGKITKDEFPHARRFAEMDADKDGALSKAEVEENMDRRSSEKAYGFLERYDLNEDGKITREEFTGPARIFEAKDKNHDGVIDKSDTVPGTGKESRKSK